MKKRILAFMLVLCLIFSLAACSGSVKTVKDLYKLKCLKDMPKEQSDATPLFWKVTAPNGEVAYLFGSIHVADSTYLRLSDQIMQAYIDCDALAVEFDLIKFSNNYNELIATSLIAMYTDGTNLDNHITKALADEYINYLKVNPEFLGSQGIYSTDSLRQYKPAYISGIPSSFALQSTGLSSEYGVDLLFLNMATEMKKEIVELETPAFQAGLLYDVPDVLGKLMIIEAMNISISDYAESTLELYEAWKDGDLDYFEQLLEDQIDLDGSGYTEEEALAYLEYIYNIYDARNIAMAEKIINNLTAKKSVFVVVGAAHMVGENGITTILAAQGYTVEMLSGNSISLAKTIAA